MYSLLELLDHSRLTRNLVYVTSCLLLQDLLSCASVVHVWLFPEMKKGFHLIKVGLHLYYYIFQCFFCWQLSLGLRAGLYYSPGTAGRGGPGAAGFMSPCIGTVALCNIFIVEIHIARTLKSKCSCAI